MVWPAYGHRPASLSGLPVDCLYESLVGSYVKGNFGYDSTLKSRQKIGCGLGTTEQRCGKFFNSGDFHLFSRGLLFRAEFENVLQNLLGGLFGRGQIVLDCVTALARLHVFTDLDHSLGGQFDCTHRAKLLAEPVSGQLGKLEFATVVSNLKQRVHPGIVHVCGGVGDSTTRAIQRDLGEPLPG